MSPEDIGPLDLGLKLAREEMIGMGALANDMSQYFGKDIYRSSSHLLGWLLEV